MPDVFKRCRFQFHDSVDPHEIISYQCNRQRKRAPAQKKKKKRYNCRPLLKTTVKRGFMRTVLNILNFVLGGFATTLGWLLATLVSIVLILPYR